MKDTDLYRAMMKQAEPPAHLQTNVLERVELMRREHEAPTPRPTVAKRHRRMPTFAKIAACLAAVVLVVGGAVAAPLLMNSTPNEGTQPAPTLADAFGLALYADAAEPGQTVSIATDESGLVPWSSSGGATINTLSYRMNLTCVGEEIETVTYRIEGDDVRFMTESRQTNEDGILVPESGAAQPSPELTIDYANQHSENLIQSIEVNIMPDEEIAYFESYQELVHRKEATNDPAEIAAIDNEMQELGRQRTEREWDTIATWPNDPNELEAFWDTQYREASHTAADKLAAATFSVTATFTDGTSAIKRYRIAPVENFDQALLDLQSITDENDPRLTASLFTITELG